MSKTQSSALTPEQQRQVAIAEVNAEIRNALNQWADIMLEAEAENWAEQLNYFPRDIMNAAYIFQHVLSNVGIKRGLIDIQKAEKFGYRLRQLIIDMTGHDPYDGFHFSGEPEPKKQ